MADWYRHDITAWMDGTEGLSDKAYRLFHVILQLIYLNEGPILFNKRGLAGRCNMPTQALDRAMIELTSQGKVVRSGDHLMNIRAGSELDLLRSNRDHAGKGGRSPRQSRNKSLKNKDASEAPLQNSRSLLDKTREEKSRQDKTHTPAECSATEIQAAFDEWNETARELNLPIAETLTPARRKHLKARLNDVGIAGWKRALANLSSLPFCLGEGPRGWRANFDFLVTPSGLQKVLEKTFEAGRGPPPKQHGGHRMLAYADKVIAEERAKKERSNVIDGDFRSDRQGICGGSNQDVSRVISAAVKSE